MRGSRKHTIIDVAQRAGVVQKHRGAGAFGRRRDQRGNPRPARCSKRRGRWATSATTSRSACARAGSGMLGLVIPDIANPFWAEVAAARRTAPPMPGSSLLVFSSDWDHARESRHLQALKQARVDGVIINPVADSFDELDRFGLPFVMIGSSAERFPDTSSVGSDITQAVRLGLDHLISGVIGGPGCCSGRAGASPAPGFLRAVHDHCLERDVDPASLPIEEGEYTVDGGYAAMKRILAADHARPCHRLCRQRPDGARRPHGGARSRAFAAPSMSRCSASTAFPAAPSPGRASPPSRSPRARLGRRAIDGLRRRNSGPRRP